MCDRPSFAAGVLLVPLLIGLSGDGARLVLQALTGRAPAHALWLGLILLSLAVGGRPLALGLLTKREATGGESGGAAERARALSEGFSRVTGWVKGGSGSTLYIERAGKAGDPMLLLTPGLGQDTSIWEEVWPLACD